jgi:hypothetical protein
MGREITQDLQAACVVVSADEVGQVSAELFARSMPTSG